MTGVCSSLMVGAATANVDVLQVDAYLAGTSTKVTSVATNTPVDIVVWVSNTGSEATVRCDLSSNGTLVDSKSAIVGTHNPDNAFQFVFFSKTFSTAGSYTLAGKTYISGVQVGTTKSTVLTVTLPPTSNVEFVENPTFSPTNPMVGESVGITVKYKNSGTVASSPFVLVVTANGLAIYSKNIEAMAPNSMRTSTFNWVPGVAGSFNICAEIIY